MAAESEWIKPSAVDVEVIRSRHPELVRVEMTSAEAAAQLHRLAQAHALLRSCEDLEPVPGEPGVFRVRRIEVSR